MSEATPKHIVRTALLATWGVITLLLVLVVSVLVYRNHQRNQNPLDYAEPLSSTSYAGGGSSMLWSRGKRSLSIFILRPLQRLS